MLKAADHPTTCTMCGGTGWMPAPPEYETINGKPHEYQTWTTCTWHWTNDPPEWDIP